MYHHSVWHGQLYVPPNPAPPPPVPHKVWIMDCRTCGTFFTNRGMKAVLLLRPSVGLYSSDALPVNCSAHSAVGSHSLKPLPSCPSQPPRTCECLTQTLCCHGCGKSVGYMIVIPCARCTSSVSASSRATNGHRFVFHASEIRETERHYIENEAGVVASTDHVLVGESPIISQSQAPRHENPVRSSAVTSGGPEYLPTPPLDSEDDMHPSVFSYYSQHEASHLSMDPPSPIPHYSGALQSSVHLRALSVASDSSVPPAVQPSYGLPAEQPEPSLPSLAPGDVLYWHHLARHGEIPGVMEDPRARRRTLAVKDNLHFDR
ncbi:unnamed protein product [Mycena citricolor]|uniref:Protein FAM72A n=1 Tax=Mycena citricolor TaxID=2018698 RepID=A0AAD2HV97_9AGAR|nr:unnamed protein product [Mycena citricolor]